MHAIKKKKTTDGYEFIGKRKFTFWTSTLVNVSLRSGFGLTHDATASQKKMKSRTTPLGLMLIIWQTPLNDESFSSLSRILRREVHLNKYRVSFSRQLFKQSSNKHTSAD